MQQNSLSSYQNHLECDKHFEFATPEATPKDVPY